MNLADTNVWLALVLANHAFHNVAKDWVSTLATDDKLLFCRATQQSLLRLVTTAAVMSPYGGLPLTNREAWQLFAGLLADPRFVWCDEPQGIDTHWQQLASRDTASPKLWMDAYLASFAITGGYRLVTTDKAFQQHSGLDLQLIGLAD